MEPMAAGGNSLRRSRSPFGRSAGRATGIDPGPGTRAQLLLSSRGSGTAAFVCRKRPQDRRTRSSDEGDAVLRVLIGLGLPFVAIVVLLPVVNLVQFTLWNIPFLYIWMFAWFVLTSVCLSICWFAFDRHRDDAV
jgi:hypothetical protein